MGAALLAALTLSACASGQMAAPQPQSPSAPVASGDRPSPDPRIGLSAGFQDAGEAAWNMELVAHLERPATMMNSRDPFDFSYALTDMAFRGDNLFVGSYNGVLIYDISNPEMPRLRTSLVCPGGQGDVSVQGNLLFMSVEQTRGRVDCGTSGASGPVNPDRLVGVRIFDISNIDSPRQVAAVQTCRGSHTHTLVNDPDDSANVYLYVSGTGAVRSEAELEGCRGVHWREDPSTAYWRIEVIRVPLANPAAAEIVNAPRIFADPVTGDIGGLWPGGDHGANTQESSQTNQCHDITVYPEIGLAAGACAGNGILLDISDPANPVRIDEVVDPAFSYWHSATFNRDGSKIVFTDEWGGGGQARCKTTDPDTWGANAIFSLNNRELEFGSYYKLPAPQTAAENCVAHNGSLIPIPGRDVMVQAWYQGGISIYDFTDASNPVEIAFFDRGPTSLTQQALGGYWSVYWYNGYLYATEINRGLDVFRLEPSAYLSESEIEAAERIETEQFNPQLQTRDATP